MPDHQYGWKFLYQLQEGEQYTFYEGLIIVTHPNRPPKIVYSDGSIEELKYAEPPR